MSESTAPDQARACSKCGIEKPLSEFAKASWCRDGRRGVCKACRLTGGHAPVAEKACTGCGITKPVSAFQRRAATPDGYHQRCRECRSAYRRERYPDERDEIQAAIRAWRAENPEKVLEAAKRWARANADRRRGYDSRRRARKRDTHVGPVDVRALWTGVCPLCGAEIDETLKSPHPMSKSLDHIIPLSLGGSHEQSNLQWTHLRCNIRKGARPTI